jgi:hypothetical protein
LDGKNCSCNKNRNKASFTLTMFILALYPMHNPLSQLVPGPHFIFPLFVGL